MITAFWNVLRSQKGGTAIEYGLIASLIVLAMVGALGAVADENTSMWNNIRDKVVTSK